MTALDFDEVARTGGPRATLLPPESASAAPTTPASSSDFGGILEAGVSAIRKVND